MSGIKYDNPKGELIAIAENEYRGIYVRWENIHEKMIIPEGYYFKDSNNLVLALEISTNKFHPSAKHHYSNVEKITRKRRLIC